MLNFSLHLSVVRVPEPTSLSHYFPIASSALLKHHAPSGLEAAPVEAYHASLRPQEATCDASDVQTRYRIFAGSRIIKCTCIL